MEKSKRIGILTSGGDCPGLNAAIRGVAKPLLEVGDEVIGILDGFRGLIENRTIPLGKRETSGLLVQGGTILGTSRYKPYKYIDKKGNITDRTEDAVKNYKEMELDALVCIGGGGTQKNAYHLMTHGIPNVLTLPKTIDNDIYGTDVTFGYDTGMAIACEAIDRLHTTASSHHRCMLVDIMGHNTGWLALGAGLAGGADVILIPEFPFETEIVLDALRKREVEHKRFSIIAVAEGALTKNDHAYIKRLSKPERRSWYKNQTLQPLSHRLANLIEDEIGIETRVTSLGHLQRGGIPSAKDRLLSTKLGVRAAECIMKDCYGVMLAVRNDDIEPVPLKDIVGKKKEVTRDDLLVKTADTLGVSLGI